MQDGKLTAWTHSQGVYPLRGTLARALKMQGGNIRCIHMPSNIRSIIDPSWAKWKTRTRFSLARKRCAFNFYL